MKAPRIAPVAVLAIFLAHFTLAQAPDTLWTFHEEGGIFGVLESGPAKIVDSRNLVTILQKRSDHSFYNLFSRVLNLGASGDSLGQLSFGWCGDKCFNQVRGLACQDSNVLVGITMSDDEETASGTRYRSSRFIVRYEDTLAPWAFEYGQIDSAHGYACTAVEFVEDDRCVAVGSASTPSAFAGSDILVVTLDKYTGSQLSTHQFDLGGAESALDVCATRNGGFVVVGSVVTSWPQTHPFVLGYDSSASLQWQLEVETTLPSEATNVIQRRDGSLFVGCTGDCNVIIVAENGSLISDHRVGQSASHIKWCPDSSFLVANGRTVTKFRWDYVQVWTSPFGPANCTIGSFDVGPDFSLLISTQENLNLDVIRTERDLSNVFIIVTEPIPFQQLLINSLDTIRWNGVGFEGGVSIEINRSYPIGQWEEIAESTENDGNFEWIVTDPLSDSCRIKICALQDTFCDISNDNFSIVSSQGYLALVRSMQPTTAIVSWTSVLECPTTETEIFALKNFGSEPITVSRPSGSFTREFAIENDCDSVFVLAPNQTSTCDVQLFFTPDTANTYHDTLRIQTDAVNGVNGYVSFPLSGSQIRTPESPEIVLSTVGNNAILRWSPIVESVGHCQIDPPSYLVFFSEDPEGPFWYHGGTNDTTYTHVWAIQHTAAMFYHVYAVQAEPGLLASLPVWNPDLRISEADIIQRFILATGR